ncbi:MAG: GxxExxY protein [Candidatus Omnitrophota bacterium]
MKNEKKFLYKELSYKLVGCFYDAYNELGPAHKEQVYHEALKILFAEEGITYQSKPKMPILFRDKRIGVYEPDFLIEEKIIVEIKSTQGVPKAFEQQLTYYVKGTKYKIGYLVNFGESKIDIRRKIYD